MCKSRKVALTGQICRFVSIRWLWLFAPVIGSLVDLQGYCEIALGVQVVRQSAIYSSIGGNNQYLEAGW